MTTQAIEPPAPTAPPPAPPIDNGNGLLGETPATLTTGLVNTPNGQRAALTIRTPSTTLTVFLGQQDARTWAEHLRRTAEQMTGGGLIIPQPGQVNL